MIIAGASVLVIGALAAGMVSVIGALAKMRVEQAALTKTAGEIHDLVNGGASRAAAELKDLREQIEKLHQRIADSNAGRLQDAKQARHEQP